MTLTPLSELSGQKKILVAAIALLGLVALSLSSYLTWVTWQQSTVAGCTGGSGIDCDEVLTSGWSKWLGIPVSLLGAITYVGILALVIPAAVLGGWAMTALLTLAMTAAGAAAWFIGTQAFLLEHFCLYCMAVHCCGILICVATILLLRSGATESNVDHMSGYFAAQPTVMHDSSTTSLYQPLIAAVLSSIGLAGLIGGQMLFAPSGMEIVENTPLEIVESMPAEPDPVSTTGPPVAVSQPREQAADPIAAPDDSDKSANLSTDESANESADDYDKQIAELFPEEPAPAESGPDTDTAAEDSTTETVDNPTAAVETPAVGAPRYFRFNSLSKQIDAAANPVIGNPYAECRFVEMMDYTCPHCRKLNPFIRSSVERYGDQLGFLIYHVPLSRKCNQLVKSDQPMHANACEYARLAYSVWRVAPQKFEEYHDWLLEGKKAPPLHEAKQKAMELAGSEVLTDKSLTVEANERVVEHANQVESLKVGLPVLVFEEGIIRGMPSTEAEWFQILEQRMGLKPLASATN